ncbi:MAG: LysR family transcriptional regulator [Proteobacteria bacterium]|nr:LysR family transcriptional regulator [Pseudomonadota bacterium]MBI3496609.1 LysR family transcriptional regulator [Pseudomonadota bacterium]
MPQNIALLRQFLAVAKAGSVSAGAQALAMSQPAVSKAIHRLEDELGVVLFERRARGVLPTRFGKALLRHAKLIETEWSFAQAEITAFRKGHVGQLRIGGGPFFGVALLPLAIAKLHQRYPKLRIDLRIGVNTNMLPRLLDGDVDILVGRLMEPDDLPSYVVRRHIADLRLALIASRDHPLAGRRRIDGRALANYPFVVYQEDREGIAAMIAAMARLGAKPPRILVESTSLLAVFQLLRSGPYLSYLAPGLLRAAFTSDLVEIKISESVSQFSAGAMFPRTLANVEPVEMLVDLLRQGAQPIEAWG